MVFYYQYCIFEFFTLMMAHFKFKALWKGSAKIFYLAGYQQKKNFLSKILVGQLSFELISW